MHNMRAEKVLPNTRLRIIVVGAGMGGLFAAFALSSKGHEVTVLESSKRLMTGGAGIQIPPVSTRTLRAWGLEEQFAGIITIPRSFEYRNYLTGDRIGGIPMNPYCAEWYGSPWWLAHRADYQRILYDAAVKRGTTVIFDCTVQSVDWESPSVTVIESGSPRIYEADLIIGADGLRSKVRTEVLGDASPPVTPSSLCAYRALVPVEDMRSDPLLSWLMDPEKIDVNVWLGPEHMILAYPVRQGSEALYNLVLVHPHKDAHSQSDLPDRFPRPATLQEVDAHYTEFGPQVQKLMSVLIPEGEAEYIISQLGVDRKDGILEWRLNDLPPLPTWLSSNRKVVLIGDASSAQYPYMSAGAAMAVEDGAALAECLDPARLAQHELSALLEAFEHVRKPRNDKCQQDSAGDAPIWSLPKGSKQERRDELFQLLDSKDRQTAAEAAAKLKEEGIGKLDFGDPVWMEWAWGYDVTKEMNKYLNEMSTRQT